MAFSAAAYNGAGLAGSSCLKKGKSFSLGRMSALLGGGAFAGLFAFAAFASLHSMAAASHGVGQFEKTLVARLDSAETAIGHAAGRDIHVRKFSRLSDHSHGPQKAVRLAGIMPEIGAKEFRERFGAAANAKGQATVKELAALRPSAIVDSALGRTTDVAYQSAASQHPAFEVALARPQIEEEASSLLPDDVPLPSFRPEVAAAETVEPSPRPALSKTAVASAPDFDAPVPLRAPQQPKQSTGAMLAFAKPDNPMREPSKMDAVPWPDRGNGTAIYDISSGTVHMPNGEKLEAHSGIGKMRDNPDFVHVRMRGSTPPSSYRLTMREARFHGVEAIRLTPENGVNPHGRDGLLAHTYMLAKRGESNGCVVFRDYSRFLAAFKRGEVKRMVVVPKLNGNRPTLASSGGKSGGKTLLSMFSRGNDS
ncbi:MAG: tlde1 domain-containing protein [Agrobacterium sp.]|uniref:tlde1 domain-containing protein n=1 Tax=Agrobacterium sp. TaxID=361 RepID=UPI004033E3C1